MPSPQWTLKTDPSKPNPEGIKLYSMKAISIAAYFGGPLAAGIIASRNYINMGRPEAGRSTMILGILTTLLLFIILFSIPEKILDKIPNALFALIDALIIYLVIEKFQGPDIKLHKENNGIFYSAWRAAGVGAVCTVLILGGVLSVVYLQQGNFDAERYDVVMNEFYENEQKALVLYDNIENKTPHEIITLIDNTGIPAWKRNVEIINELDQMEDLPDELKKQNEIFRKYVYLRIEVYELIRKSISDESATYHSRIKDLNLQIDALLNQLEESQKG